MATVKVIFHVDHISNVMLNYDQVKVYRSDLEDGTYAEVTGIGTRVVLDADESIYEYIDTTAPTSSYWYKTAYFHSVSSLESSLSGAIQGIDGGLYCTISDIRDEDISETELSDDRIIALSTNWQQWFESVTRNFFTPKELTLDFDGDGSRMLQLPVPIIECTELYLNDDFTTAVDTSMYTVYNRRGPVQDDRRNPSIKLKSSSQSIYTASGSGRFNIGDLNQRVVGIWGFTEPDGSVPAGVTRAIKVMIIATGEFLNDSEIDQLKIGRVIEEVTDRHRIEYSDLYNRIGAWSPTGLTDVDMAIRMYSAPMQITAPRNIGLLV